MTRFLHRVATAAAATLLILTPLAGGQSAAMAAGTEQPQASSVPAPLLRNGGFEQGTGTPQYWTASAWQPTAQFSWGTWTARTGGHSARITAPAYNDAMWSQVVPVKPQTLYRLSGWIKTNSVANNPAEPGGPGASLGFPGTWVHTPALTGTHDWTFVSVVTNSLGASTLTVAARLGYSAGTGKGTAWFDDLRLDQVDQLAAPPPWKVLVLVYPTTDFTARDSQGVLHHYVGRMTSGQVSAAGTQATSFLTGDVPVLDSHRMVPTVTVRTVSRSLALAPDAPGFWPSPQNTAPDRDPAFDSVIVIWQPTVVDSVTGRSKWIGSAAGLTPDMGSGQTYTTLIIEAATAYGHRNVFRHEWGHSILFFFAALSLSPTPTVNNHANAGDYVHCPTGAAYVWVDETLAAPVPNSIYNDGSGFTHDYYSGTTATADAPTRCLGITGRAWRYGGPLRLGPVLRLP